MSHLTADDLRQAFSAGTEALAEHRDAINALNVFPVPDGDTGTNMLLTMRTTMEHCPTADGKTIARGGPPACRRGLLGCPRQQRRHSVPVPEGVSPKPSIHWKLVAWQRPVAGLSRWDRRPPTGRLESRWKAPCLPSWPAWLRRCKNRSTGDGEEDPRAPVANCLRVRQGSYGAYSDPIAGVEGGRGRRRWGHGRSRLPGRRPWLPERTRR